MFGAGFMQDMINKNRYNESIKTKRIERTAKIKDLFNEELGKSHQSFNRKKIDPEKLEQIKIRIRRKLIIERRIQVVVTVIVAFVLIVIMYKFLAV